MEETAPNLSKFLENQFADSIKKAQSATAAVESAARAQLWDALTATLAASNQQNDCVQIQKSLTENAQSLSVALGNLNAYGCIREKLLTAETQVALQAAATAKANAETAENEARQAKTNADTAKAEANQAKTNAETAKAEANQAKTNAETAKADADRLFASAKIAVIVFSLFICLVALGIYFQSVSLGSNPDPVLKARTALGMVGTFLAFAIGLLALSKANDTQSTSADRTSSPTSSFEYGGVRLNLVGGALAFVTAMALMVVAICSTSLGWQGPSHGDVRPQIFKAEPYGNGFLLKGTSLSQDGLVLTRKSETEAWSVTKSSGWNDESVQVELQPNSSSQLLLVRFAPPSNSKIYSWKEISTSSVPELPQSGTPSPSPTK